MLKNWRSQTEYIDKINIADNPTADLKCMAPIHLIYGFSTGDGVTCSWWHDNPGAFTFHMSAK